MANDDDIAQLKNGVDVWNAWRDDAAGSLKLFKMVSAPCIMDLIRADVTLVIWPMRRRRYGPRELLYRFVPVNGP